MKQGLRLAIGSWKIMAMSLPMILRRSAALTSQAGRGRRRPCRSAVTVAVHGSSPMTASIATDLPEPDFADDRQHFARVDRRANAVDGAERARCGVEVDDEVLDLEEAACQVLFSLGSSASRRPSPIRLMASTVIRMARPGKVTTHQARRMNSRAVGEHGAPFRRRRLRAHAEEAERRGVEDGVGEGQRRLHDQRRQAVRQDGHEHQPEMAGAGDLGGDDIFAVLLRHHRGARQPHEMRLQHQRDREHGVDQARARGSRPAPAPAAATGRPG